MSPLKYISREFQNSRRVLFNIFWYGSQLGLFAYGWYSQVIFEHFCLVKFVEHLVSHL